MKLRKSNSPAPRSAGHQLVVRQPGNLSSGGSRRCLSRSNYTDLTMPMSN